MKTLVLIGTRPEAIKMAPVLEQLQKHADRIQAVVCSTGQHRQMLDPVLSLFGIVPDIELNLMRPDQSLAELTARLFPELDRVVSAVRPDWVLAQGDTSSVFVSALTAYYRGARFGHVEAGLRTGDNRRPFPEEVHRRIASVVADLHFAPTEHARQALLREGVPEQNVRLTGNTVVDAVRAIAARPFEWSSSPLAALPRDHRIVLITAHRRESFGEPFRELCLAIGQLAEQFEAEAVQFVYPVHLNPQVQRPVRELLSDRPNVHLIEPLDYVAMVHLMKCSSLILTDSGGIQEEAPSLGVPVLVLRDRTERPEGIEAGVAHLVGTDRARIVSEALRLLRPSPSEPPTGPIVNPYGDGQAASRIVAALLEQSR